MEGLKGRIEDKLVSTAPGVEVLGKINDAAARAVDVLTSIMDDEGEKPTARINAAKVLMSYATDLKPPKEAGGDDDEKGAKHLHLHLAPKQVEWMRRAMKATGNDHVTGMIDAATRGEGDLDQ